eukprot:54930_1
MEHLIQFRLLSASLNDDEKDELIVELVDICTNTMLISAIFDHLARVIKSPEYDNKTILQINSVLFKIIEKRDVDTKEMIESTESVDIMNDESESTIIEFQHIPSDLIRHISSYLQMKDHMSFEQSSREVYVSCNSPSTLQNVDFTNIHRPDWSYPIAPLKKYRFAKRVQAHDVFKPTRNLAIHGIKFVAVERLVLDGAFNDEINYLLENPCTFPFANITHLELALGLDKQDNDQNHLDHIDNIISFLSKFEKLQYLYLKDFDSRSSQFDAYPEALEKLVDALPVYSNLLGLTICRDCNIQIQNKLCSLHHHTIRSLRIHHHDDGESNLDHFYASLPNVEELHVRNLSLEHFNKIQAIPLNLKMITIEKFKKCIVIADDGTYDETTDIAAMNVLDKRIISELIAKQTQLEFIKIHAEYYQVESVMATVQNALTSRKFCMDQISMSLIFDQEDFQYDSPTEVDMHRVMKDSQNIADVLNECGRDFILLVTFKDIILEDALRIQKIMANALKLLENKHSVHMFNEIQEINAGMLTQSFTICNKWCRINGYSGNGHYVN